MLNENVGVCPGCGLQLIHPRQVDEDKLRRSAARMLAQHLVFSLNVRHGKELVMFLGNNAQETDNIGVITSWVLGKLDRINQWPMPSSEAVDLIERLEKELASVLHDLPFGAM